MALTNPEGPDVYPYKLIGSLLTRTEKVFFIALRMAAGKRYAVFPKVRLLDLCRNLDGWTDTAAFNHVSQQPVDFVLCAPHTLRPVLALELADRAHVRARTRVRDGGRDEVLRPVGLAA